MSECSRRKVGRATSVVTTYKLLYIYVLWGPRSICTGFLAAERTAHHRGEPQIRKQRFASGPALAAGRQSPELARTSLTVEQRERMMDLGYSANEALEMRVELAASVLERGIQRPWGDQPMPRAWRDQTAELIRKEYERRTLPAAGTEGGTTDLAGMALGILIALAVVMLSLLFTLSLLPAGLSGVTSPSAVVPEYTLRP